jgi:hypothetical protein
VEPTSDQITQQPFEGFLVIVVVVITADRLTWSKTLARPNFNAAKRKLLWMQNGGEAGVELDDIQVTEATP